MTNEHLRHMTYMPYLTGLLGIYIANLHRPLNGIRVSSTHACAPMEYTFWQVEVKMLKMLDTAAAGSCPLLSVRVEESSNLRATNKTSHLFLRHGSTENRSSCAVVWKKWRQALSSWLENTTQDHQANQCFNFCLICVFVIWGGIL